ncbi:MAG TPA: Gfo/Idh/MocA family oxidoreductase [Tepidisphaeraceae bacterium]|jgi:predicted dehydrogenase|nr:Gfo/Idh/MocA family oxidoreductase [Tepidisphaeraceae bacterium]
MTTIAVLGVSHIHITGFTKMLQARSDIKVKSVWDPNPVRAKFWAEQLNATVVADEKTVYSDAEVQAVVICSETNRHAELVEGVAAAKKHLFVEKPLGMAAADAYRMADAIEKAGVIFQTGYFQRGAANVQFLKQQIDKGAFGKITRVRGSNCHSGALGGWFDAKPDDVPHEWLWMTDTKQSGVGAFGDLGTHSLDILIWLFGEIDTATAQLDNGTNRYGCDEAGEGLIRFKSGIIGTLAASWVDTTDPLSYQITGTEGHAAIIKGQLFFSTKHDAKYDGKQPVDPADMPKGLPHAFELFLDAITGKKDLPLVKPRDAAYRSAVMEAMYEGARTNAWVKPK